MATWAEFANVEPELAAFARERMEGRIVYQATLRLDGGPRVHPVSPWLGAGLLCVSFRDTSPKMREVARDARCTPRSRGRTTPATTASSWCADGSNRSLRPTRR